MSFRAHPPTPAWGLQQAAGWISGPLWSMGYRGTTCCTVVFSMGCRGICSLAHGAPPPHPSSLTLMSAELFLSHFYRSSLPAAMQCIFYPFLNTLSWRHHQVFLLGFGQQQVHPGAVSSCLCLTWGQLLVPSHKSHTCSLPCYQKVPT